MNIQLKKEMLTGKYFDYAKTYERWKDKYNDDRRLYQNIYETLLEALEVIKNVDNTFIEVAFDDKWIDELKTLDNIIKRFKEMGEY